MENKIDNEIHTRVMILHIKALAAHCECLGMNAENCYNAGCNIKPQYRDYDYLNVLQKWGLVDNNNRPTI